MDTTAIPPTGEQEIIIKIQRLRTLDERTGISFANNLLEEIKTTFKQNGAPRRQLTFPIAALFGWSCLQ